MRKIHEMRSWMAATRAAKTNKIVTPTAMRLLLESGG
jgi:hypothetical protein